MDDSSTVQIEILFENRNNLSSFQRIRKLTRRKREAIRISDLRIFVGTLFGPKLSETGIGKIVLNASLEVNGERNIKFRVGRFKYEVKPLFGILDLILSVIEEKKGLKNFQVKVIR